MSNKLAQYEAEQFYADMHSHNYEHEYMLDNCMMCKLLYRYKAYRETPSRWDPPRDSIGNVINAADYIRGLCDEQ